MPKTSSKIFLKLHPALPQIIPGHRHHQIIFVQVGGKILQAISKHREYSINGTKRQLMILYQNTMGSIRWSHPVLKTRGLLYFLPKSLVGGWKINSEKQSVTANSR